MKKIKYKASYEALTALEKSLQSCINSNNEKGYAALVTFAALTQLYLRLQKLFFYKKQFYTLQIPMLEACAYCHYYEKGKLPVLDEYSLVVVYELYQLIDKQVR